MDMEAAAKDSEEWLMLVTALSMELVSSIFTATLLSVLDVQQAEVSNNENGRKHSQICSQILMQAVLISKEKALQVVKTLQTPLHLVTKIQKITLNQKSLGLMQFQMSKTKINTPKTIRLSSLKTV